LKIYDLKKSSASGMTSAMNRFLVGMILLCFPVIVANATDESIWLDVKINGQPVRFVFDTGAGGLLITRDAADRLGLKIINAPHTCQPPPGLVDIGWTEKCRVTLWNKTIKTRLIVGGIPKGADLDCDGLVGWPSVNKRIFSIDAATQSVKFLERVPEEAAAWTKLRVQANSDLLNLEIPMPDGKTAIISLDTGRASGVDLNPPERREWELAHTNQPTTMSGVYFACAGIMTAEETWAHKIALGPLELMEVPVEMIHATKPAYRFLWPSGAMATLGLAAMNQLDIIIDGKHNMAYLRPKNTPPLPYEHNRLGAAFVPRDSQNDDLVAQVADGSPAYEAGIRNGDVLSEIDGRDVTNWRISKQPNSPFCDEPAGTKLELTLKRGDKVFKTTVVLRNILPPDPPKHLN
jgi:Aspartyl protease/PDZ domain